MKRYEGTQIISKIKSRLNKNRSKGKSGILFLGICLIIGFILGFLQGTYLKNYPIFNSKINSGLDYVIEISKFILIFGLGFLIHIIIHEAGHLIFGLLSGYSFVSFRVGSFILIKEKDKFKIKRYNIPGTGGQCLMMPPELKDGRFPFIMYNFGGVLMNLIVSIISILVVVYVKGLPPPLQSILILSSLGGIIAGLTNGIPMKIGGIANDAYNILSMSKDEEARKGFYLQLRVNGLQSQGIRIKDMPLEDFILKDDADLSNPLNTALKLIEYSWYLDHMDLENGRKAIDSLMPYFNKIVPLYQYEINCERVFLELLGDCDKSIIDILYDGNLGKYIKRAKFMLSKRRLIMAYEAYYNEDKPKTLRSYEEIKRLAEKSPVKGDADMEIMIADWIMEDLRKTILKN